MSHKCQLYLISPPQFELEAFGDELARALSAGPVAAFQLRMKECADDAILAACARLLPLVRDAGRVFILNDRPDLAARAGVDGVHIGQTDGPFLQARQFMGPDRIVGVTCHNSRHLAMVAAEAGADYVAFGAFYPSKTKAPPTYADGEILEWWQEVMEIPCVAIGGITTANAAPIIAAGADFIAVSAGVWSHPQGPEAAVRAFKELLTKGGA
jgi:thiamine-phosphate pyrophosphorylase